jgi:hypothetical protein
LATFTGCKDSALTLNSLNKAKIQSIYLRPDGMAIYEIYQRIDAYHKVIYLELPVEFGQIGNEVIFTNNSIKCVSQ